MYKFKFADIGEGLHEGSVGEIYVKNNQDIKEGDPLFSVETDKVNSDIPSPVSGKIHKILIKKGQTIHVGEEIFHIDDGKNNEILEEQEKNEENKEASSINDSKKSNNDIVKNDIAKKNKDSFCKQQTQKNLNKNNQVLATPYARKLAADKNIDINSILGSGYNGRVLSKDILNYKNISSFTNSKNSFSSNDELLPFSETITPLRKAIANAMVNSWQNVAYTNLSNEVNMTKLWEERKHFVEHTIKEYNTKISFTSLIALATIKALKKFPILNSKYNKSNNSISHSGLINLGIAVDTPRGLVVPVIKNAHTKNIIEISQNIIEIAKKARDNKLSLDDMSGGTFTLTNYGSAGAMFGVPVINYPEIAILGTGVIVDRVFGKPNGEFYNGKVMNLTCAADHRWVDGAEIGRFITYIKSLLENPILLLGGF